MNITKKRILLICVLICLLLICGCIFYVLCEKFVSRKSDIVEMDDMQQNGFNNFSYCGDIAYVEDAFYYVDNRPFVGGTRKVKDGVDTYLCKQGRLYGYKEYLFLITETNNKLYKIESVNTDTGSLVMMINNVNRFIIEDDLIMYSVFEENEYKRANEKVYQLSIKNGTSQSTSLQANELPPHDVSVPMWTYNYDIPRLEDDMSNPSIATSSVFMYNKIGDKEYISSVEVVAARESIKLWDHLSKNQNKKYVGIWKLDNKKRCAYHVSTETVVQFALFNDQAVYYVRDGRLCVAELTADHAV